MSGPVALHGGGEFHAGDEPFLEAIIGLAATSAASAGTRPLRVVVVPTAAAGVRPDMAAAHGVEALGRAGRGAGIVVEAEAVLVVDGTSAADPPRAAQLLRADLVYLPGGDPALVPAILAGTPAWAAIVEAHERGSLVAGASAGAMALTGLTWTPRGFREGLGLVGGMVVVPHFEQFDRRGREADLVRVRRERLGVLGLDERTGVIREAQGRWKVAGAGEAHWLPFDGAASVGRHGDVLPIDG